MRAFVPVCVILILGLFGPSGQSLAEEPVPRVAYFVGSVPPMPDADQTIDILTRRLDGLQLNPSIRQQGTTLRVEIDEPSEPDQTAVVLTQPGLFSAHEGIEIVENCSGSPPEGTICLPTIAPAAPFMVVAATPVISGNVIARAVAITEANRVPQVALSFTDQAARVFSQFTTTQIGTRLAIVIDGRIITAPRIQAPITSGTALLAGPGIPALGWSVILSFPPLPEPLEILGREDVEPSQ